MSGLRGAGKGRIHHPQTVAIDPSSKRTFAVPVASHEHVARQSAKRETVGYIGRMVGRRITGIGGACIKHPEERFALRNAPGAYLRTTATPVVRPSQVPDRPQAQMLHQEWPSCKRHLAAAIAAKKIGSLIQRRRSSCGGESCHDDRQRYERVHSKRWEWRGLKLWI